MRDLFWFIGVSCLVIVLVAAVGRLEYSDGYRAGMAARPQEQLDQQCVTWLFKNNLSEARKRMCGRKP